MKTSRSRLLHLCCAGSTATTLTTGFILHVTKLMLISSRVPEIQTRETHHFQHFKTHFTILCFSFLLWPPHKSLFQPCPVNTVGYLLWTPECWQYFHFIVAGQDNKYRFIIKCPTFHTMQICPACSLLLAVLFPKGPLGRGYQPD